MNDCAVVGICEITSYMKKRSAKFVFLNGKIVPEEKAVVSVFDRGFQLGDGLFETMRVYRGRPFLWEAHLARLRRGAEFVGISLPMRVKELRVAAGQLIRRNGMPEALLRIGLSRGIGPRGYSPRGARHPTLVMSLHPVPESCSPPPQWSLISATPRLPAREP